MVSAPEDSGGEKTGKLSEMAKEALTALRDRRERGQELSGLRCGAAVCGHISELEARGLVRIGSVERDGEAWKLDLALEGGA